MTQETQKLDFKELAVAEFREFETKMTEFKEQYDNVIYDLEDVDQEKQARSDRFAIGKVISALDNKHKELKSPLKAQVDLIDGERKRIKDALIGVQGKIKFQIEEHDRKIQEHAEMLEGMVEAIRDLAVFESFAPTSEQIFSRLHEIKTLNVDDTYEHRKADATLAQVEAVQILESLLVDRQKNEAEQAELEQLRKEAEARERADREERIRAEASEKAKREAEQAALQEIEVAKRKQREAEQAAERAAQDERKRIEAEQREANAKAAQIQQTEDAKKAKQAHRGKIHAEAKRSFIKNGIPEKIAGEIVTLIKDGAIKNIQMCY